MSESSERPSRGRRPRPNLLGATMSVAGIAVMASISQASASPLKDPPRGEEPQRGEISCFSPPTPDNCKDEAYLGCRGKQQECAQTLQSGFQAAFTREEMRERYQSLDDRRAIIEGRTKRNRLGALDLAASLPNSYEGKEIRAQVLAQDKDVEPSSSYTRNPRWEAPGAIASCDEYTYEKYLDYMHFVDAANSCKNDKGCVVDMAYAKGPGGEPAQSNIADRTLKSRFGTTLPRLPLSSAVVPKNAFYPGVMFLTPHVRAALAATHPQWAATLDDVLARGHAGINYYRWGDRTAEGPPIVRGFADEFGYHRALRTLTRDVPLPEALAHRKRIDEFQSAYQAFATESYCAHFSNQARCWDLPKLRQLGFLESVGGDPWIRTKVLIDPGLRTSAIQHVFANQAFRIDPTGSTLIPTGAINVGGFLSQEVGVSSVFDGDANAAPPGGPGGTTPGNGGTPAPLPWGSGGGTTTPAPANPDPAIMPSTWLEAFGTLGVELFNRWSVDPPVGDATSETPRLDCDAEEAKGPYRQLACNVTNIVLDELSRDNPGCFDTNYYGCDWEPSMFSDRFHKTAHYMAERSTAYNECMRWTNGDFSTVPILFRRTARSMEEYFQTQRDLLASFPAPRENVPGSSRVQYFGEEKGDRVAFGSDETFGGGYTYRVGWRTNVKERTDEGAICRMDFNAEANFRAWASALGFTKDIVDAAANVRVNTQDQGEASFYRKFIVVGKQILAPSTTDLNLALSLSKHEKKEHTIFRSTYPLPYGFFVTIKAGIELAAGVTFLLETNAPQPGSCNPGKPVLGFDARLDPYAKAALFGSAYGSWLGILEGGLEVEADLIRADVPVVVNGGIVLPKPIGMTQPPPEIEFNMTGKLAMSTLAGNVDVCGCFTVFCGCHELVSWPGLNLGTVDLFEPIQARTRLGLF